MSSEKVGGVGLVVVVVCMSELRLQQVGKGRYLASSVRMYMGGCTQAGCMIVDDSG